MIAMQIMSPVALAFLIGFSLDDRIILRLLCLGLSGVLLVSLVNAVPATRALTPTHNYAVTVLVIGMGILAAIGIGRYARTHLDEIVVILRQRTIWLLGLGSTILGFAGAKALVVNATITGSAMSAVVIGIGIMIAYILIILLKGFEPEEHRG